MLLLNGGGVMLMYIHFGGWEDVGCRRVVRKWRMGSERLKDSSGDGKSGKRFVLSCVRIKLV